MALGTFMFDKVTCTMGGSRIAGFAKGTVITVEAEEDDWIWETGADGHTTRILKPNKTAKIVFRLQQTSSTNEVLSAKRIADRKTGVGTGQFLLKDLNGTTMVTCMNTFIQKPTKIDMGDEVTPREWTIIGTDCEMYAGSNLTLPTIA